MRSSHYLQHIILITAIACLFANPAFAWFGFGNGDTDKSGLDLNRGYDINTVTTITGRVASVSRSSDHGTTIEVKSSGETVSLYVGPGPYWDKNGIQVRADDEVSARGSRGQGKDGKIYLLAQKVVNRTNGTQVQLRSETGQPNWLSADRNQERSSGGIRGGSMMRSGGGSMMRNGGGMMRH